MSPFERHLLVLQTTILCVLVDAHKDKLESGRYQQFIDIVKGVEHLVKEDVLNQDAMCEDFHRRMDDAIRNHFG